MMRDVTTVGRAAACALLAAAAGGRPLLAQVPAAPPPAAPVPAASAPASSPPAASAPAARPPATDAAWVELNLPPDAELRVVVEYIVKRLGLNVIYDEKLNDKRVTLAAGSKVAASALPGLLASVLKAKGLALVDADVPGWQRIVAVGDPTGDVQVAALPATHLDPGELADGVRRLLGARLKAEGSAAAADVSADPRSRQVIVVGPAAQVAAARALAKLIDVPVEREQTPVRFYKLANTTAADVLETIRSLDDGGAGGRGGPGDTGAVREPGFAPAAAGGSGASGQGTFRQTRGTGGAAARSPLAASQANGAGASGALASGGTSGGSGLGAGLGAGLSGGTALSGSNDGGAFDGTTGGTGSGSFGTGSPGRGNRPGGGGTGSGGPAGPPAAAADAVRTNLATIAADANTNSIIVVGPPPAQRLYADLIRQLDRRRPQVLVESTIVTVDTTRELTVGVEIAGRRNGNDTRRFVFSSFGFSEVDRATGQLNIVPGAGLNGAVLSPDIADVIVRALTARGDTKIVASPRVLVNDNATGTLFSVAEQPVTEINANNTISTTSFGGYAKAGTEIALTPHISEKDYLQLDYEVTLSSFTGQSANGIPPARQTNTVASRVTIPDGSTIVVGGLNRTEDGKTVNGIPILGDLPFVGALFRSTRDTTRKATLFVFLRPTILRDDEFADLRFLSERDVRRAGVKDGAPASEPMLVE